MTKYYVTTWDIDKQAFTPQHGVRKGPWSLWGLRRALRMLRDMGYQARRGDPSVLVESDGTPPDISPSDEAVYEKERRLAKRAEREEC